MGALSTRYELAWKMRLCEMGFSCFELVEQDTGSIPPRRWGWVINAAESGWLAHVGGWGQAQAVGRPHVPLTESCESFDKVSEAKLWVEESVAEQWKTIEEDSNH